MLLLISADVVHTMRGSATSRPRHLAIRVGCWLQYPAAMQNCCQRGCCFGVVFTVGARFYQVIRATARVCFSFSRRHSQSFECRCVLSKCPLGFHGISSSCDVNGLKVPPCNKACEFLSLQDQGDRLERLRCCLSLPKPFLWYLVCNISEVDISIPIPSPRGIIACTLRDAQSMSIRDMEHEIAGCRRHVCTCQASVTPLRPLRCVARPCPGTQADRSSRTGRALRGRS